MSLRRDLMVLVHFFNQSLWWFSSTFGPTRSRGGRSRCAWRLHWLWFFRWGCILLSVLGEVTPSVDWSDVTSTELDWVTAELGVFWSTSSTSLLQFRPSFNWTWKEAGDVCCTTVPACHFCPDRWSRARTQSPTAISLNFANLSWLHFILSCWLATRDPISDVTKDNRVGSSRCKNSLAGDEPVVACGVLL